MEDSSGRGTVPQIALDRWNMGRMGHSWPHWVVVSLINSVLLVEHPIFDGMKAG